MAAMEIKIAFAAGLFIMWLLQFGLSLDVPDDVVYTEIHKTLVLGATGILRCRFKGAPNAVYWKKGNDLASAQTVMIWVYGQESGPSHEDGSYDIDGNYSLVIKNVKNSDAGRYICRISNYKGFLIDNYTDVTITDDALKTRSVVFLKKGSSSALPCRIKIRPKAVTWKKGTSYSTATTLVKIDKSDDIQKKTWPGFRKNSMDILEDYALLIKDVNIQDEGYYFCEVIDFDTSTPFWDSTIVNVTAEPRLPYPCMEQCSGGQQCPSFCTFHTNSPVTLECSVSSYYPSITLTFLRETEIINSSTTVEWINEDGTKSKKITIVATNENSYYECVASHVPGSVGNSSKLIHVIVEGSTPGHSNKAVAIAVSVIVAVICCAAFFIFLWKIRQRPSTGTEHRTEEGKYDRVPKSEEIEQENCKKGSESKDEQETVPEIYSERPVSYAELWEMVIYARQHNLLDKLMNVVKNLNPNEIYEEKLMSDVEFYRHLCKYKFETKSDRYEQAKHMNTACTEAGLTDVRQHLEAYSGAQHKVTDGDLEHILWHINSENQVRKLLKRLTKQSDNLPTLKDKGIRSLIEESLTLLKAWRDSKTKENQVVTLSLAIEEIQDSPFDNAEQDFFTVPDDKKKVTLSENELKNFVLGASSTHCQFLVHSLQLDKAIELDNIIEENEAGLFAARCMIEEWWWKQECAPYERRCKLLEATTVSIMKGNGDKHLDAWPNNKELKQIAANVNTAFCQKLDSTCQDADTEKKRFETMCKWRDRNHRQKLTDIYRDLHSALGEMKLEGLLPALKTILLYKAEIIDVAYSLIKEDLIPFARALGIEEANFQTYQQPFQPDNLKVGTLGVLSNFLRKFDTIPEMRCILCRTLEEAGHFSLARCAIFACEPSFGELFSIEAAVHAEEKERYQSNTHSTPRTAGDVSCFDRAPVRDTNVIQEVTDPDPSEQEIQEAANTSIIVAQDVADPAPSEDCKQDEIQKKVVNDLMTMLKLSDQEVNGNTVPSDPTGTLKMFKTWKEKLRMQQVDHRASLYEGLQSINRHKIADEFIAGTYRSSGGTSFAFIQDMVQRMEKSQRNKLGKLLKLKGTEVDWCSSSDEMSLKVMDWVQGWISEMDISVLESLKHYQPDKGTDPVADFALEHRRFNDELVGNGFLDLAREIMNIEQLI